MANLFFVDGNGDLKRLRSAGSGTDGDPFYAIHQVEGTVNIASGTVALDGGNTNVNVTGGNVNSVVSGSVSLTGNGNKTGKYDKIIQVTPTISTSAYAVNDNVGGRIELANAVLANGGSCRLQGLTIYDKDGRDGIFDFLFFNQDPTAWTLTDNALVVPQPTDAPKFITGFQTDKEWENYGGHLVSCMQGLDIPLYAGPSSTSIYCAIITRNEVTYTTTSSLVLTFFLQQS